METEPIKGSDIIDIKSAKEVISELKLELQVLSEHYNKAATSADKARKAYNKLEGLICRSESKVQEIANG